MKIRNCFRLLTSASPGVPIGALAGTLLLASCASTTAEVADDGAAPETIDVIATKIADDAERRDDPNHMRVLVHVQPPPNAGLGIVASELQRDLITSLNGRFHLFDSELAQPLAPLDTRPSVTVSGIDELVEHLGLTHALIGDFAVRGEDLLVSLRLVEHDSLRIIASSQGVVRGATLTDSSRLAIAPKIEVEGREAGLVLARAHGDAPRSGALGTPRTSPMQPVYVSSARKNSSLPPGYEDDRNFVSRSPMQWFPPVQSQNPNGQPQPVDGTLPAGAIGPQPVQQLGQQLGQQPGQQPGQQTGQQAGQPAGNAPRGAERGTPRGPGSQRLQSLNRKRQ